MKQVMYNEKQGIIKKEREQAALKILCVYVAHRSFRSNPETGLYIQAVLCPEGYGMLDSEPSPFPAVIITCPCNSLCCGSLHYVTDTM